MTDAALPDNDGLSPEAVASWLRAHPRFLAENPELYRRMAPPARVHGEVMADHMAAMLHAERARSAELAERANGVLSARRADAGMSGRVQDAVLALIGAGDVVECIGSHFPSILAVDAASLCAEFPGPHGARVLPRGGVARLLGERAVLIRDAVSDSGLLHGEAAALARHDALIRVPGEPACLLALAAREAEVLDPRQGTAALAFLGRAVAQALRA